MCKSGLALIAIVPVNVVSLGFLIVTKASARFHYVCGSDLVLCLLLSVSNFVHKCKVSICAVIV